MDTARLAELQTVLEGVALPASRQELLEYALLQGVSADLFALLESLPDREYRSIDEVAETLEPVQSSPSPEEPKVPQPESGAPARWQGLHGTRRPRWAAKPQLRTSRRSTSGRW